MSMKNKELNYTSSKFVRSIIDVDLQGLFYHSVGYSLDKVTDRKVI